MKKIKHLRPTWYFGAMAVAVVIGELLATQVSRVFEVHLSPIPVAAVSIGIVAVVVSLIYDGTD